MTSIRVASFNASLNRGFEGQLAGDLSTPDNAQARAVAEIIQRTDADVVLINEFDYDPAAVDLFRQNYLQVSQNGAPPVTYGYSYIAPSNTGVASGFDLNNDGQVVTTPGAPGYGDDALGFGFFPGQFGMLVLSKYEIAEEGVRTFREFLWDDMPGARLPDDATTPEPGDFYSAEELEAFRLSSKSHWDIPVSVEGETVHLLAAHPTPPVFDGAEDRNGLRNADEIRFWADYVTPGEAGYIYDDAGNYGGLGAGERFVIAGDYNSDPDDGDSLPDAMRQILDLDRVDTTFAPSSEGGPDAAERQGGLNPGQVSDPAFDTADFADTAPGNLRVDYVLPSTAGLGIEGGAVFWPTDEDPLFRLVGDFDPATPGGFPSSDHRLVHLDLAVEAVGAGADASVTGLAFLGAATFPTGLEFGGTTVGGLSGLAYDAANGAFYAISDDRSVLDPARFYTLTVDLGDGALEEGDVAFTDVTTITDGDGDPFPALSLDPEGIALTDRDTLFISSEGENDPVAGRLTAPFVREFSLGGREFDELPVDAKFLPAATAGIRNNLAFESLTVTPDGGTLYTATENALAQDGPAAAAGVGSPSRIVRYDLETGEATGEFVYLTEPVADPPVPAGSFATNGLVELLALDDGGTLLALERSFSVGVGNSVKLYEVTLDGATDVSGTADLDDPAGGAYEAASKRLLLDLGELGITLDNLEGLALGPTLPDGRASLVVVSDNNFSGTQVTQFLAFALDLAAAPAGTIIRGSNGDDPDLAGTRGDDTILGYAGDDTIAGAGGDDALLGGAGQDILRGRRDDDRLLGGEGADGLDGGRGDDLLDGGLGTDLLRGGRGTDLFVLGETDAVDFVADFKPRRGDQIRLDIDAVLADDAGAAPGAVEADLVRAVRSGRDLLIEVDLDGSGGADGFVAVARLLGVGGLSLDQVLLNDLL